MNRATFRRVRDEFALEHYRAVLPRLKAARERLYAQYQDTLRYLKWAKDRKDRNSIDRLQYELYDPDSGAACLWAEVDAQIFNIEQDMIVRLARTVRPKVIQLFEVEREVIT